MKQKWNEFAILPESWGIVGIVILGFVFLKRDLKYRPKVHQAIILNHERIHVRQWVETGFIVFPIWYLLEYLIRYLQYRNWDKAYRNISFEREAYANEGGKEYLYGRKIWSFVRYL